MMRQTFSPVEEVKQPVSVCCKFPFSAIRPITWHHLHSHSLFLTTLAAYVKGWRGTDEYTQTAAVPDSTDTFSRTDIMILRPKCHLIGAVLVIWNFSIAVPTLSQYLQLYTTLLTSQVNNHNNWYVHVIFVSFFLTRPLQLQCMLNKQINGSKNLTNNTSTSNGSSSVTDLYQLLVPWLQTAKCLLCS